MALRPAASRRNLLSEGRERATRGGKREKVVKPILVDRLQLRLQCPGSDPKASFEEFEYGFPRPFGFEFLIRGSSVSSGFSEGTFGASVTFATVFDASRVHGVRL